MRLYRDVAPAMFLASVLALAILVGVLGCRDDTQSPTAPEPGPTLATTAAHALSFSQVSVGAGHTCAVTTDSRAYCWGGGGLGDGNTTGHLTPVAVAGGLRFLEVSAGVNHNCGVTTDYRAFCWGDNTSGQLGTGTITQTPSLVPVAVAGGRRFRQVSAGNERTCAVNRYDVAFCWGGGFATPPAKVPGGLKFRRVSVGYSHTCGATTDDRAYCWGDNSLGQLGDGTHTDPPQLVAVVGGLRFRQVRVGNGRVAGFGEPEPTPDYAVSCGVTTDDRAYCWGDGALGDGNVLNHSYTPVAVAGGRHFRGVTLGAFHTCAVNPFDVAFCWGRNTNGQLGTGGADTGVPVRVAGGLRFSGVSASGIGFHTCGVTTDHRIYCWGNNASGQLGDGTTTQRSTPVAVAGTT
jgi:alpha-tubulin suppressor-like RCC1 family protein